jgi:hypothetical protein
MNRNTEMTRNFSITSQFIRKIKQIAKAMSREKSYTLLLLYVIVVGTLILPSAVASLEIFSVYISSSGTIAQTANATSGSIEDIQAAIDWVVAAGGGTVYIPEGTFTFDAYDDRRVEFTVPAGGIQIIGAGIDTTVLEMPVDDGAPNTLMFVVHGLFGGRLRISGITFKGRPNIDTSPTGDCGIFLESCRDFRVYNCSFYWMGSVGVVVTDTENTYGHEGGPTDPLYISQGVVDHCDFIEIYKSQCTAQRRGWGYGVSVSRAYHYLWTVPNLYPEDPWTVFGKYDRNVYIEDCYFTGCRHATHGNWGGAYVLRYSVIEDQGMYAVATTGHPVRENVLGLLTCEIYGVTLRNNGKYVGHHPGFLVEGGSGLLYDNSIENIGDSAFVLGSAEYINPEFYPLGNTKETYIWNNQLSGASATPLINENVGGTPVEGTDFFTDLTGMYTTEQVQALVDAKNYSPYTYPHPLTLQEFP